MLTGLVSHLRSVRQRISHSNLTHSKKGAATNLKHKPEMSLSSFLLENKQKYLDAVKTGKGQEWTIVVGNEAGDLDSIASAIAYAWFASATIGIPHIALLQTPHRDLKLRPENIHAFSLASLTPDLKELLCIDDISSPTAPFPSNKFALVDHNHLLPRFTESNPSATVVAVIDHHEDEGLYKDTAKPRAIQVPTGSCTSLVTLHIAKNAGPDLRIPPELATLILCAMLIDTNGLKEGGKAVQADHEAAAFLVPQTSLATPGTFTFSTLSGGPLHTEAPVQNLTKELNEKKFAIEGLTTVELLRRDYKQYTIPTSWTPDHKAVIVGLATVPLALESWISRDAFDFWKQVDAFMDECGLDVLGILTTFFTTKPAKKHKKSKSGDSPEAGEKKKNRRQALFVVRELPEGGLEEHLWAGIEGSAAAEFEFEKREFEEYTGEEVPGGGVGERKARAYEQKHAKHTRKTVAPLIKRIIEGPKANEEQK